MNNENNQLDQVIELLKDGTDLKLLDKSTKKAITKFREAEAIIDQYDLPDPWPQLVQYRLAHLLMRNAGDNTELLEEIDLLLAGATKVDCLGPLPRLYRLSVLHRLGKKPAEMKTIFENLINQVGNYDNEFLSYDTDNPITEKLAAYEIATAIQSSFFNMIELASYFTGYPYSGFEGIGRAEGPFWDLTIESLGKKHGLVEDRNPFYDLFYKSRRWHLTGTISGLATKNYPGRLAIQELESRMYRKEMTPPCIAFKISDEQETHHWNFNLEQDDNGFVWKKVDSVSSHLKFLTSIFECKNLSRRSNVLMFMFNDDGESEESLLRKWKQRCTTAILKEFSINNKAPIYTKKNLFINDKNNEHGTYQLNKDISVLGAVDSTLRYGTTKDNSRVMTRTEDFDE